MTKQVANCSNVSKTAKRIKELSLQLMKTKKLCWFEHELPCYQKWPNLGSKKLLISRKPSSLVLFLCTSLFTNENGEKSNGVITTGNQISSLRTLQKKTCETQSRSPMSSFQRLLLMVSHVWGVQEQRSRYAKGTCCSNKLLL